MLNLDRLGDHRLKCILNNMIISKLKVNGEIKTKEKYSGISFIDMIIEFLRTEVLVQRRNYL